MVLPTVIGCQQDHVLQSENVADAVPEMQLPELDEPLSFDPSSENRLIINILPKQDEKSDVRAISIDNKEWDLSKPDAMKDFLEFATKEIKNLAATHNGEPPLIMFRADATVYYSAVLPIMATLQQAMAEALDPEIAAATPIHLVAYIED